MTTAKIGQAEKILVTVGEWIRSADQKISILLAMQGIILALLIPNYLKTLTARFQTNTISAWNGLFVISATILLGLAIFQALNAIFPRISNKANSHHYFGSIRNMSLQKFTDDLKRLTSEDYFDELCEQIHTNSKIAVGKHARFQKAILLFLAGMGLFVISYISLKFF